jgi:hypothetical protein
MGSPWRGTPLGPVTGVLRDEGPEGDARDHDTGDETDAGQNVLGDGQPGLELPLRRGWSHHGFPRSRRQRRKK